MVVKWNNLRGCFQVDTQVATTSCMALLLTSIWVLSVSTFIIVRVGIWWNSEDATWETCTSPWSSCVLSCSSASNSSFLLMIPIRKQIMAQVLPSSWENWIEFQSPDFKPDPAWLLEPLWRSLSLYFYFKYNK